MSITRPYLMNTWYVAALSSEVDEQSLFHRKILDTSVLIYRLENGKAVAMQDRCPHRFAPLHLGRRVGDEVTCFYHALKFDGTGTCTHNPHGKGIIPNAAKVRTYALEERDGFLWIWMGSEPPSYKDVPDYSPLAQGSEHGVGYTYIDIDANFELLIDNVMDLSHIDHIHGEIISTRGQLTPLIPKVKEEGNSINAHWDWTQTPAMLIFAPFLDDPEAAARHFFDITWTPPANIQLSVAAVQGDKTFDESINQYDLHIATPESISRTHYFFATRRNHDEENAEYNKLKIEAMHRAFYDEDKPVIEAVGQEMGTAEFFELNPVLLTSDVAPVRVRKLLRKLINQEQAASIIATDSPALLA